MRTYYLRILLVVIVSGLVAGACLVRTAPPERSRHELKEGKHKKQGKQGKHKKHKKQKKHKKYDD
ncbi:MAG TPA: hypothetical protein VML75_00290 [Kofleriaceae bacterium]|nr:hypothetical protein [Kofleriaceae bacterium]